MPLLAKAGWRSSTGTKPPSDKHCPWCRYTAVDEQLHKDVEGVLEMVYRVLEYLHKRQPGGGEVPDPSLLVPLLEFWDGICWCWSGKPKPSAWVGLLMKTAKMFSQEARQQAVATAVVRSSPGQLTC